MLILIKNTNQIFVKNLQFLVHSWYILGSERQKQLMVLKALIVNSFRAN